MVNLPNKIPIDKFRQAISSKSYVPKATQDSLKTGGFKFDHKKQLKKSEVLAALKHLGKEGMLPNRYKSPVKIYSDIARQYLDEKTAETMVPKKTQRIQVNPNLREADGQTTLVQPLITKNINEQTGEETQQQTRLKHRAQRTALTQKNQAQPPANTVTTKKPGPLPLMDMPID